MWYIGLYGLGLKKKLVYHEDLWAKPSTRIYFQYPPSNPGPLYYRWIWEKIIIRNGVTKPFEHLQVHSLKWLVIILYNNTNNSLNYREPKMYFVSIIFSIMVSYNIIIIFYKDIKEENDFEIEIKINIKN